MNMMNVLFIKNNRNLNQWNRHRYAQINRGKSIIDMMAFKIKTDDFDGVQFVNLADIRFKGFLKSPHKQSRGSLAACTYHSDIILILTSFIRGQSENNGKQRGFILR